MKVGGHMTAGVGVGLQVGGDAALVPQQAAVTQFDGGNQLGSTFVLRLVTETDDQLISDTPGCTCAQVRTAAGGGAWVGCCPPHRKTSQPQRPALSRGGLGLEGGGVSSSMGGSP